MMIHRYSTLLLAFVAISAHSQAVGYELIQNGDFSAYDPATNTTDSWTESSANGNQVIGDWSATTGVPGRSARLGGYDNANDQIFQRFTSSLGGVAQLSFDLLVYNVNGGSTTFTLELLDAGTGNTVWAQQSVYGLGPTGWTPSALTYDVSPFMDGTDKFVLFDVRSDFAGFSTVYVSNVSLVSSVPEPGTMAALGLGLAAIAARRRRKA